MTSSGRRIIAIAIAFGLVAIPGVASAAPGDGSGDEPDRQWHLVVGAGTDFPIAAGAHARVEAPFRLRLSTSVGILPGPYVDAINGIVIGVGGYDDATATLVKSALKSSLVWRTHVGYRPFPKLGLYGELGYGLVALGGSASGAEIIAGVTGLSLPPSETQRNFEVQSVLHMVDVEIGWDFELTSRLYLRTAIGGAFTAASSTSISPSFTPRSERVVSEFARYGESYLDDIYTSYVFTPVVSVGLGYRLF